MEDNDKFKQIKEIHRLWKNKLLDSDEAMNMIDKLFVKYVIKDVSYIKMLDKDGNAIFDTMNITIERLN